MTVLNVVEHSCLSLRGMYVVLACLCVIVFIVVVIGITSREINKKSSIVIDSIFAFILVCLFAVSVYACINTKDYKEIKCTIDNTVSFNEIYDKYEVVNKEGYIYTLYEKEYEKEKEK